MGKKEGKKREREIEEEEEEAIDPELQAELNAIMAIRNEKLERQAGGEVANEEDYSGTYNAEAMLQCCESLGHDNMPFVESMQIAEFDLDVQDGHDDLEREMSFYNHALASVNVGRTKLSKLGIKFRRPDDFFCESVKSDAHMARVSYFLLRSNAQMLVF